MDELFKDLPWEKYPFRRKILHNIPWRWKKMKEMAKCCKSSTSFSLCLIIHEARWESASLDRISFASRLNNKTSRTWAIFLKGKGLKNHSYFHHQITIQKHLSIMKVRWNPTSSNSLWRKYKTLPTSILQRSLVFRWKQRDGGFFSFENSAVSNYCENQHKPFCKVESLMCTLSYPLI